MSQPPYPPQPSAENDPARQPEPPYDPARPAHPTEPGYDPPRPPRAAQSTAQPAYDPAYPPQPTGPMDGAFPTPPPPLPGPEISTGPRVGARPTGRSTADRAALTAAVVGGVGAVLLLVGLSLPFSGPGITLWTAVPAWSAFALLAALVALVPQVPSRGGLDRQQAWQVGAAGAAGLGVFWLLVVVFTGEAASNRGFVLTLAVALVAGSVWLTRRRTA